MNTPKLFLHGALATALTLLSAAASTQPLPHPSFNSVGRARSLSVSSAPIRAAQPSGNCSWDGICLVVTLALDDPGNPGLCGTATNLSVTVGDSVNICYTVTNDSTTTLEYQTLSDDHVGSLLSNDNVVIAPGASYQYNRTIIATLNPNGDTGSFVSTWTATDVLPSYAVDATAPFNFVDISTTGTALSLDIGEASTATMPFAFSFYGASSADLCIGNNGEFRFTTDCPYSPNSNQALPASNLNGPAVLPYWNLMLANGTIYYATQGSAPNRQFVVEYQNKFAYGDNGDPTGQTGATFEVLLNEADASIDFEYQTASFGGAAADVDDGAAATVGLQFTTTVANQYSYDTPSLSDGLALHWTPSPITRYSSSATATLDVGTPNAVTTPDVATGFAPNVAAGGAATAQLLIDNIGNRDLTWNLSPPAADAHFPKTPRVTTPVGAVGIPAHPLARSLAQHGTFEGSAILGGSSVPTFAEALTDSGGANFVTFDALHPQVFDTILSNSVVLFGSTFINDDFTTLYGVDYYAGDLYRIDTADGSATLIGNTGVVSCCIVLASGMRWDPTTGTTYLVITDFNARTSALYTIDLDTAAVTLVGNVSALVRDITFSNDGLLFGVDSDADTLVAIDKTSGTTQTIGSLGIDAVFGEGLDFDGQTGTLYLGSTAEDGSSTMYELDPTTGAATQIGALAGEFDSMAIAKAHAVCATSSAQPWLSFDVTSGTVAPDPSQSDPDIVNVTFDATSLAPGEYKTHVCVYTNDTVHSRIAIPVKLTVTDSGPGDEIFADDFDGGGAAGR